MKKLLGAALCILPLLHAQDFTHFEAASIRESPPGKLPAGMVPAPKVRGGVGTDDPAQITYETIQIPSLVAQAYGLEGFQMVFNPKDKPSPFALFDIAAKIPAGATQEQFKVMLQNLLVERFHLRFHKEMRDTDVYALVVGPNGPKLKKSAPCDDPSAGAGAGKQIAEGKDGFLVLPPCFTGARGMPKPGLMHLSARNVPVSNLAGWLDTVAGRPIVDQTGLTDHYDFDVEFQWMRGRGAQATDAPDDVQSVFTMVDHDLGLKLEPKKVPFEYLVIDNLDPKPTDN